MDNLSDQDENDEQCQSSDFYYDVDQQRGEVEDESRKFVAHSKNVVFLSISNSGQWLASGSEDDTAILWDWESETSSPYHVISHSETVSAITFNYLSTIVATGDMSGQIICTHIKSRNSVTINDGEQTEWLQWHPFADILFAGFFDGSMWMWLISTTDDASLSVVQSKVFVGDSNSPCVDGAFSNDLKHMCTVHQDGNFRYWNLKTATSSSINLKCSCSTLDVFQNVAAVGSLDGTTTLINLTSQKILSVLGDKCEDLSNSVESVKFATQLSWLSIGTSGGFLSIYDYENMSLRHTCDHDGMAVVKSLWFSTNNLLCLVSACIDGCLRIWDAKTGYPLKLFSGGGDEIYHMALLGRTNHCCIFSACSDGAIRAFDFKPE